MAGRGTDASEVKRFEAEARTRLAGRLETLRRERDYSMSFLADAAQIGRGHLSSIFAGQANVGLATLVKLAYALEVDVAALLADAKTTTPAFRRGRPRTRRVRTGR